MAEATTPRHEPGQHPDLSPPATTVGVLGWLRKNLFSSWLNAALTIGAAYLLFTLIPPIVEWALTDSVVSSESRGRCDMGAKLANMGTAMSAADLSRIDAPATQDQLTEATDFLSQFRTVIADHPKDVQPELAAMVSEVDLAATEKDLQDAIAKRDTARIETHFTRLAPLADWGAVRDGACWTFAKVWFDQFMYGRYPASERWRVDLAGILLILWAIPLFIGRFPGKRYVGATLLLLYPLIAYYLFTGFSRQDIVIWPLRMMGFAAMILGVLALLPHWGVMRERPGPLALALLVLTPIWGLSAPSTWTTGIVGGAATWAAAIAILVAVVGPLAVVVGLYSGAWRAAITEKFWQIAVGVAAVIFVGACLPILFWDPVAGPSPPFAMAITLSMLALAAICPWSYQQEGVLALLTRLLLPLYFVLAYVIFAGPPDWLNLGLLDWTWNTRPLLTGIHNTLPVVETALWGGLFVTLVIAGVGIVASLPIGIVLALGRRSKMPIMRLFSVIFIEVWRGVPLISVLFMASVMFPLFLPEGTNFDKLLRALCGVALFASAYMAEVVRGGLQAIPKGQYEAAEALGLSYWKMMSLIVLPQALKLVIPGIVNTFIGLFKDTTLVLIIGLFDLLGAVQQAATNPDWLGFAEEGYVFAGFGFWIFCFGMSRYSQFVERKLHTGHKRN